jgi:hypothetical protein
MPTVKSESPDSFETLINLTLEELKQRSLTFVKTSKAAKSLRERVTKRRPQAGKIMAAFKVQFSERVEKGSIPKGTTFKDYFSLATKGEPDGKVEQCANTFNSFVVTNLIDEKDYDYCASDWLEKASVIVRCAEHNLENEHVLAAATILKDRPNDGAKLLNLIKAKQRGNETKVDENGDPLNLEGVVSFIKMASEKGYGADIATTLNTLIREHGKEWDEKVQRATFDSCEKLASAWTETVGEATIDGWLSEAEKADSPIQIVAKPEPIETVMPNFAKHAITLFGKKLPEDKVAAAGQMVGNYYEVNKNLPETTEVLNAFAEQAVTAA